MNGVKNDMSGKRYSFTCSEDKDVLKEKVITYYSKIFH